MYVCLYMYIYLYIYVYVCLWFAYSYDFQAHLFWWKNKAIRKMIDGMRHRISVINLPLLNRHLGSWAWEKTVVWGDCYSLTMMLQLPSGQLAQHSAGPHRVSDYQKPAESTHMESIHSPARSAMAQWSLANIMSRVSLSRDGNQSICLQPTDVLKLYVGSFVIW